MFRARNWMNTSPTRWIYTHARSHAHSHTHTHTHTHTHRAAAPATEKTLRCTPQGKERMTQRYETREVQRWVRIHSGQGRLICVQGKPNILINKNSRLPWPQGGASPRLTPVSAGLGLLSGDWSAFLGEGLRGPVKNLSSVLATPRIKTTLCHISTWRGVE